MRKIILYVAMSLDGYLADSHGGVDWLSGDSQGEGDADYARFYESIDTVIMGWRTYDQIVTELSPGYWPYQEKGTFVITHRDIEPQPGICFYREDLLELVRHLKEKRGKDIWICGGAAIVQQLLQKDLIDQFAISVVPTLLGSGIRLFPTLESEKKLRLLTMHAHQGMVSLLYERREDAIFQSIPAPSDCPP